MAMSERQLVFDLSDIRGCVLECANCRTRLVIPLDKLMTRSVPQACPVCVSNWASHHTDAVFDLVRKLQQSNGTRAGAPLVLKLTFDEPPA